MERLVLRWSLREVAEVEVLVVEVFFEFLIFIESAKFHSFPLKNYLLFVLYSRKFLNVFLLSLSTVFANGNLHVFWFYS